MDLQGFIIYSWSKIQLISAQVMSMLTPQHFQNSAHHHNPLSHWCPSINQFLPKALSF